MYIYNGNDIYCRVHKKTKLKYQYRMRIHNWYCPICTDNIKSEIEKAFAGDDTDILNIDGELTKKRIRGKNFTVKEKVKKEKKIKEKKIKVVKEKKIKLPKEPKPPKLPKPPKPPKVKKAPLYASEKERVDKTRLGKATLYKDGKFSPNPQKNGYRIYKWHPKLNAYKIVGFRETQDECKKFLDEKKDFTKEPKKWIICVSHKGSQSVYQVYVPIEGEPYKYIGRVDHPDEAEEIYQKYLATNEPVKYIKKGNSPEQDAVLNSGTQYITWNKVNSCYVVRIKLDNGKRVHVCMSRSLDDAIEKQKQAIEEYNLTKIWNPK